MAAKTHAIPGAPRAFVLLLLALVVGTGTLLLLLGLLRAKPDGGVGPLTTPAASEGAIPRTPGSLRALAAPAPETQETGQEPRAREIHVVSARDGTLLEHAHLTVSESRGCSLQALGAGRWTLGRASAVPVSLDATAPGYAPAARLVGLGDDDRPVLIVLAPIGGLQVFVHESGTGNVLPDASVEIVVEAPGAPLESVWASRTDRHGEASCPALSIPNTSGHVVPRVSAPAHVMMTRVVDLPATSATVFLERGEPIEVLVRDAEKRPLAGATVACSVTANLLSERPWQAPVTTNADGIAHVVVRAVEPSLLAVAAPGHRAAVVEARPADGRIRVDLSREEPGGVVVRTALGAALAGVEVVFTPWLGPGVTRLSPTGRQTATTDERGVALLSSTTSESFYLVTAGDDRTMPRLSAIFGAGDLKNLPALVVAAPRRVAMIVQAPDGSPLSGVGLFHIPARPFALADVVAHWNPRSVAVETDRDGTAEILLPRDSDGVIVALAAGFAPAAVVPSEAGPNVITLDPGVPLIVEVVDQDGAPWAGAAVVLEPPVKTAGVPVRIPEWCRDRFRQRGITGRDGSCEVVALATRSFLHAECPHDESTRRELIEDEILRGKAVVRVVRRGEVTVKVIDRGGDAIASATVIPRIPGCGGTWQTLRRTNEDGVTDVPLPLTRPDDERLVTFLFGGAAQGECSCRLVDVRDGKQLVAERAAFRELLVTVTDPVPTQGLPESLRYSIARSETRLPGSGGTLKVGIPARLEVPADGARYLLRVSWEGGASSWPIPDAAPTFAVSLPKRFLVRLLNRACVPVEADIVYLGRSEVWLSPVLLPGTERSVLLAEDPWRHAITVSGLPGGESRLSFNVAETSAIEIEASGPRVVYR